MDRAAKGELADRLRALAARGAAVLVATHDAEFAAAFAERVVLLADGRPIADGPTADVLSGRLVLRDRDRADRRRRARRPRRAPSCSAAA